MNDGFILLHRKIRENIFWPKSKAFTKAEAWIDLLMMARFDKNPKEILLGNEIVICGRGQIVRSINTYQKRWNWGAQRVKSFFEILLKLKQIEKKTTTKTTIITICNYDSYQSKQQTDNKRKINEKQTDIKQITTKNKVNKEDKVNNNIKIEAFYYEYGFFKDDFAKIWFNEFLPLKKIKKAAITERALKSQLKKIAGFSQSNYKIALEILEKSVNSGWTDFYQLKDNNSTRKKTMYDINPDISKDPNRMSLD